MLSIPHDFKQEIDFFAEALPDDLREDWRAQAVGDLDLGAYLRGARIVVLARQGDVAGALALAQTSADLGARLADPLGELLDQIAPQRLKSETQTAVELLRQVVASASSDPQAASSPAWRDSRIALAHALIGSRDSVHEFLEPALRAAAGAGDGKDNAWWPAEVYGRGAVAFSRLGDPGLSDKVLSDFGNFWDGADRSQNPFNRVMAAAWLARVALTASERDSTQPPDEYVRLTFAKFPGRVELRQMSDITSDIFSSSSRAKSKLEQVRLLSAALGSAPSRSWVGSQSGALVTPMAWFLEARRRAAELGDIQAQAEAWVILARNAARVGLISTTEGVIWDASSALINLPAKRRTPLMLAEIAIAGKELDAWRNSLESRDASTTGSTDSDALPSENPSLALRATERPDDTPHPLPEHRIPETGGPGEDGPPLSDADRIFEDRFQETAAVVLRPDRTAAEKSVEELAEWVQTRRSALSPAVAPRIVELAGYAQGFGLRGLALEVFETAVEVGRTDPAILLAYVAYVADNKIDSRYDRAGDVLEELRYQHPDADPAASRSAREAHRSSQARSATFR